MPPEIDLFWKLLTDSQLVKEATLRDLRSGAGDIESNLDSNLDSAAVAQHLVQQKLISPLQSAVLLAGHSGPFDYGRYRVTRSLEVQPWRKGLSAFAGVDRNTGFAVRLDFYDGKSSRALQIWKRLERQFNQVKAIEHPNLLPLYQTIELPKYRFIVSELPTGKRLCKAIPSKARVKFGEGARIAGEIAEALLQLKLVDKQRRKTNPPALTTDGVMNQVWIGADRSVKMAPLAFSALTTGQATFLVSALFLRISSGRSFEFVWNASAHEFEFDAQQRDQRIASLELPSPLAALLKDGLANSDGRSESSLNLQRLRAALGDVQSQPPLVAQEDQRSLVRPSAVAYLDSLRSMTIGQPVEHVRFVPEIKTASEGAIVKRDDVAVDDPVRLAQAAAVKRKRNRWKMPAAIAGGIMTFGLCLGLWASMANWRSVAPVKLNSPSPATVASHDLPISDALPQTDASATPYVQRLIEDDAMSLWESPTTGGPIRFSHLLGTAEIVVHLRPAELMQKTSGRAIFDSLGPDFQTVRRDLEDQVGVRLDQIVELTVALVPDEDRPGYTTTIVVDVQASQFSRARLLKAWGQPDEVEIAGGQTIYVGQRHAWLFVDNEIDNEIGNALDPSGDADRTRRFVVAAPNMMQAIVESRGQFVLGDALGRLVNQSDRDRHVTLLATAQGVSNEDAAAMLGHWKERLLPSLRLLMPDAARAVSLSFHIDGQDEAEYLELQVDHTADSSTAGMVDELNRSFANAAGAARSWVKQMPPMAYWNRLKGRWGAMVGLLDQQTRWGAEFDQVRGNAWLPRSAVANLVAGSELALAFADSVGSGQLAQAEMAGPTAEKIPQTFEELLATPRSLNVTNPPDLNVLLSDIAEEVGEDFPLLPFAFKIKLLGTDLRTQGITQNQRPGPLAIENQPLSTILTNIMTSANPDKSISGPADKDCKLVWVLANDPDEPGQLAILITTRSAAQQKGYSLPAPFVEK